MTNAEQRRLTNWRLTVLQAATDAGNVAHLPAFRDFMEDLLIQNDSSPRSTRAGS